MSHRVDESTASQELIIWRLLSAARTRNIRGMKRAFLISFAVGVSVNACLGADSEDGFVAIFDGKTFNGWKPATEHPDTWKIENGAFVAHGPRDHLFYVGYTLPFK